ncbi:MAG TPA: tetratricopeptide repeat protein [Bacteroidota bacterium]|nr:tetratricopeptide repeat protein [Bacteroidota bacterium]
MSSSSSEQRRLAAIMFTDIVGYSAVTQRDESLALRLLNEQKKILRPLIPCFDGRVIETIGDAFFVEFPSALQAALCAAEIQKTLHGRNAMAAPGEEIRLRIGLHVGDVVHSGANVHGDGVNIAARVQQVALPGGICLSEDVARQVQNKIPYRLLKLGRGELKNIRLPVDIYCLVLPWEKRSSGIAERAGFLLGRRKTRRTLLIAGAGLAAGGVALWMILNSPAPPAPADRIAVLPFLNISRDQDDEYFADGLTEELISNLSKLRDMNVIARTSVFKYKNAGVDIAEIGRLLNVGSILEGSVRKNGNTALITVNLTDVATQKNLWSQDYTREITDVFAVQADISMRVAEKLKITMLSGEEEKLRQRGTENPDAFRYYLRGREAFSRRTEASILNAIGYFNNAVTLDPEFALAFAGLADCYTLIGGAGYTSMARDTAVHYAKRAARRALELDGSLAEAHASLAYVQFRLEWNFKDAEAGFRTAIDLKPGYAKGHEWYALLLAVRGRFDEALAAMRKAGELDPLSTSVSTGVGRILYFRQEYDESIVQFRKALTLDPLYAEAYLGMGLTYRRQKKYREAAEALGEALRLSGGRKVIRAALGHLYGMQGNRSGAETILESLKNPPDGSRPQPFLIAVVVSGLGRTDEALDYLEKACDEKEGLLLYLYVDPMIGIDPGHPRFMAIIRKIGLRD